MTLGPEQSIKECRRRVSIQSLRYVHIAECYNTLTFETLLLQCSKHRNWRVRGAETENLPSLVVNYKETKRKEEKNKIKL